MSLPKGRPTPKQNKLKQGAYYIKQLSRLYMLPETTKEQKKNKLKQIKSLLEKRSA